MNKTCTLSQAIQRWAQVYMRYSMHALMNFTRQRALSMMHWNLLMRLHYEGSSTISELGEHLGVTNAAASQMVQRLVEDGYVERRESPLDRRIKQVALTAAGHALIAESIEARTEWLHSLPEHFTPSQQQAIIAALDLLTQAAQMRDKTHGISD